MTQTANHPPTPWEDSGAGLIYGQVSGDDDQPSFVCDVCDSPLEYTEQEKAKAAFIVRAANNHQQLLEAVKKANFALESVVYLTGNNDLLPYIRICKDAIAKATA